jgi:hypothetical protein
MLVILRDYLDSECELLALADIVSAALVRADLKKAPEVTWRCLLTVQNVSSKIYP